MASGRHGRPRKELEGQMAVAIKEASCCYPSYDGADGTQVQGESGGTQGWS